MLYLYYLLKHVCLFFFKNAFEDYFLKETNDIDPVTFPVSFSYHTHSSTNMKTHKQPWLVWLSRKVSVFLTHGCFSPSLSPSLSHSLKINKQNLKKTHKHCSSDGAVPLYMPTSKLIGNFCFSTRQSDMSRIYASTSND